ncbi:hypothetical protein Aduo_010057 [Ancylostoma duodenale]
MWQYVWTTLSLMMTLVVVVVAVAVVVGRTRVSIVGEKGAAPATSPPLLNTAGRLPSPPASRPATSTHPYPQPATQAVSTASLAASPRRLVSPLPPPSSPFDRHPPLLTTPPPESAVFSVCSALESAPSIVLDSATTTDHRTQ